MQCHQRKAKTYDAKALNEELLKFVQVLKKLRKNDKLMDRMT